MAECDLCWRPQLDTAYACPQCAGRVRDALLRLADLADELDVTIARQSRTGSGGSGSDRHPLPVDLGASYDTDAVVNTITTWARHAAEIRGWGRGGVDEHDRSSLAQTASWLATQVEWLRHQPEASEALDELADACSLAVRIVDRRTARWYAGPCGAPPQEIAAEQTGTDEGDGQGSCNADLYAHPGAHTITCRVCGTIHDARQRREWLLKEARDQVAHAELVGRALAALGLDVDPARVRRWANRGLIADQGTRMVDGRERPVYRIGDVETVAVMMAAARRWREVARQAA